MQEETEEMCKLMKAVLRALYGTDAEMQHPRTRADVRAKLGEAAENIEKMSESTDRLARFQPAHNLDEAMRQIAGRE